MTLQINFCHGEPRSSCMKLGECEFELQERRVGLPTWTIFSGIEMSVLRHPRRSGKGADLRHHGGRPTVGPRFEVAGKGGTAVGDRVHRRTAIATAGTPAPNSTGPTENHAGSTSSATSLRPTNGWWRRVPERCTRFSRCRSGASSTLNASSVVSPTSCVISAPAGSWWRRSSSFGQPATTPRSCSAAMSDAGVPSQSLRTCAVSSPTADAGATVAWWPSNDAGCPDAR